MNFESRISCRSCKRTLIGLDGFKNAEQHAQGLGWFKEVGYTLDTWLCDDCAKKRINQEHTYSVGASYATVTTYCDTCRKTHTGIDTGYKTAGYDLTKDGWVEVSQLTRKWRCPSCWRASLDEAREKVEQATIKAREHIMSGVTVKRLNMNEGVTTILCAKCEASYSSQNKDDNMSVELFNMGWRNVNLVPHGMNWICSACAKRNPYLVQVIFPTGMSSTTSVPKKPEPEIRYPMCLVFKSGKEEIYYVTNKTREQVRMALVSNMAVQFEYFLLTSEDEPSGVFACPHGMIERMQ